jgi:hypothetical protein
LADGDSVGLADAYSQSVGSPGDNVGTDVGLSVGLKMGLGVADVWEQWGHYWTRCWAFSLVGSW